MGEHRLPRTAPAGDPEQFQIHDATVGKTWPIRECTDAQLEMHQKTAHDQSVHFMQEAMKFLGMSQNAGKAAACIAYEIDRRRRSITLATPLDLASLRKQ